MGGGHNAATMQEIRFLEDGLRQSHDMTRQLNASYQEAKELLRQNSELLSALRLLDLPEEVGVAMDRFEEMSRPRDYVQLPGEAGEADNGFEQERMKRFIHLMKVIERHQLSRCKGSTGRSRRVPAEEAENFGNSRHLPTVHCSMSLFWCCAWKLWAQQKHAASQERRACQLGTCSIVLAGLCCFFLGSCPTRRTRLSLEASRMFAFWRYNPLSGWRT
ncbi:unnamed protein product [Effrenium voratum]|nr:unnamed protein product [Effrenium voratum]